MYVIWFCLFGAYRTWRNNLAKSKGYVNLKPQWLAVQEDASGRCTLIRRRFSQDMVAWLLAPGGFVAHIQLRVIAERGLGLDGCFSLWAWVNLSFSSCTLHIPILHTLLQLCHFPGRVSRRSELVCRLRDLLRNQKKVKKRDGKYQMPYYPMCYCLTDVIW
jgi:hypothetical protein